MPTPDPSRKREGRLPAGNSNMRLAITLSITSLVPPSIEFALVRSQVRGRAPWRVSSLSHSSPSEPEPDITSSWRRLFNSVPEYFIMFELAGCARPGFPHVHEAFAHRAEGEDVDVEFRHFGAQDRVVELTGRIDAERLGEQRAARDHVAASAARRDHLAFVAEQIFGDVPAAIDGADELILGHLHIVEEGFAEGRRCRRSGGSAWSSRPVRRHVEQQEADAADICLPCSCGQGRRSSRPYRHSWSRFSEPLTTQ